MTKTPELEYHEIDCHYRCHVDSMYAIMDLEKKNAYLRSAQDSTFRDNEKLRELIHKSTIENVPDDLYWLWEDIRDDEDYQ